MEYLTARKNGASALGLQRVLGLRSCQTARTWLFKLRRAMARPDVSGGWARSWRTKCTSVARRRERADGRCARRRGSRWRRNGVGMGRVRLQRLADASAASVEAFLLDAVRTAVCSERTAGRTIRGYKGRVAGATGWSREGLRTGSSGSSREYTEWPSCLGAGCCVPTRTWRDSVWTPVSTNSPSGSTAAHPVPAASCPAGCYSRRPKRIRSRATQRSEACQFNQLCGKSPWSEASIGNRNMLWCTEQKHIAQQERMEESWWQASSCRCARLSR